jgi:hypothetical protein
MENKLQIILLKRHQNYVIAQVANLTEEKSCYIQRNVRCGEFGSHRVLKLESNNILMVT